MEGLWIILCMVLCLVIAVLLIRLLSLRRAAEEIQQEFAERIQADSNVGISISSNDRRMNQLAAGIDRQLKLLRQEQLRYTKGNQEIKTAVTNISHDLRTPLTAICGYMEMLEAEEKSETVDKYLRIIENRVQALKELTEELFRYSVIFSADYSKTTEAVSLNRALEECVAAYYGAFKSAGINPQIQMPDTSVDRTLNKQALSRILSNIISNALKYSQGDFKLVLSDKGVISFSNRADQLDEVQVGALFNRFFTVENAKNATGLGLSIAKTLTEEMGGQIEADYSRGILCITLFFPKSNIVLPSLL